MAYKILYVEDQQADSIEADLRSLGFEVESNNADDFNSLFNDLNKKFDAYILDFRLTANKGRIDAPTIAQALRTEGNNYKDVPIILISNETYLPVFDKDLTSQDLFDFVISKKTFRDNLEKYATRIKEFIHAYEIIRKSAFNLPDVIDVMQEFIEMHIDYRLVDKLKLDMYRNSYAYCRFINIALIRGIGPLIGPDILAARLGVANNEQDEEWLKLQKLLINTKYTGMLSDTYQRWWMPLIEAWWAKLSPEKLRSLDAKQRVAILNDKLKLKLRPTSPLNHAESSYFWNICKHYLLPLDPAEGFIIEKKDLYPWQENEYLSLSAAVNQSDYRKYLSPLDRKEIRQIEKDL